MNAEPVSSRRYQPLVQLILARLREFLREPEAVFWVYGFPLVMIFILGLAFRNQPVEKIVVDVIEGPNAAATRDALLAENSTSRFKAEIVSPDDAKRRLRTGKTDVILASGQPPVDADVTADSPHFEFRFDATRPQSVLAQKAVDDQLQRAAGRRDVAQVTNIPVDEPGSRYVDFLVPGLLGMNLMGGGLWGVGFVTVDMRIRKLLKRFLATPMKKTDFMAGIMISRMIFMVPEVLAVLLFARYAFGVVNHGSIFAVALLIVVGAVMFSGIGLLVASRAKTIEAVSGLMNLTMVPMWLLSGIFFSSERFPDWLQPAIKLLPLTPLIDSLRSVMLEGESLATQLPRLAIMIIWGAASFSLALKWFRWQ